MVWSLVVKIWAYGYQVECRARHNVAVGKLARLVVANVCNWCLGSRE